MNDNIHRAKRLLASGLLSEASEKVLRDLINISKAKDKFEGKMIEPKIDKSKLASEIIAGIKKEIGKAKVSSRSVEGWISQAESEQALQDRIKEHIEFWRNK